MRVAFVSWLPTSGFSGGRYHALMMIKSLLVWGAEVEVFSNTVPDMWDELKEITTPREPVFTVVPLRPGLRLPEGERDFDIVVCVPVSSPRSPIYVASIDLAMRSRSPLLFLNFETPNWFNSTATPKRDPKLWRTWFWTGFASNRIISSTAEGSKYARKYFLLNRNQCFVTAEPSINTPAARRAVISVGPRQPRTVFFPTRIGSGEHKGVARIASIILRSGSNLDVRVMAEQADALVLQELRDTLAASGSTLTVFCSLPEFEKFQTYASSIVTVFPSSFEGFGYPPIESLSVQTPCIVYDLPVFRETVGDYVWTVPFGDDERVATLIAEAIENHSQVHGLSSETEDLLYRFSVEAYSARVEGIIRPVLDRGHRVSNVRGALAIALITLIQGENWLMRSGEKFITRCGSLCAEWRRQLVSRTSQFLTKIVKWRMRSWLSSPNMEGSLLSKTASQHGSFRVVFYPAFGDSKLLADYLNRAKWYLPGHPLKKVAIVCSASSQEVPQFYDEDQPSYEPKNATVSIIRSSSLLDEIASADLVLLWQQDRAQDLTSQVNPSCPVICVDKFDYKAAEYGTWSSAKWKFAVPKQQRLDVVSQSHVALCARLDELATDSSGFSLVIGTGPSFEKYKQVDRRGGTVIACNSAVYDKDFLIDFKPDFLVFGDAAHHVGVSNRANYFRKHLLEAMELLPELRVLTTDRYFGVLEPRLGTFVERFFWVPQKVGGSNFNLRQSFWAPTFDSIMTIHMIPLAATVSKHIFILGADGTASSSPAEDFWAHSKPLGYTRDLDSFHRVHPTFHQNRLTGDQGRRLPTLERHHDSFEKTLRDGKQQGFTFRGLMDSSVSGLQELRLSEEEQEQNQSSGLLELARLTS